MTMTLSGKTVLITAGPTQEPLDPIRYITNHSSGKMGFALAREAVARGAEVILVYGPVQIEPPAECKLVEVRTALEMEAAVFDAFPKADIAICTAAVCDIRPRVCAEKKLKKLVDYEALLNIEFVENPDILKELGAQKGAGQLVVGFAAETNDLKMNAAEKLSLKNADMIIANDVSDGKVFGDDQNQASIVTYSGIEALPLMPKTELAKKIFDSIEAL